jgi:colicin import membrane protein
VKTLWTVLSVLAVANLLALLGLVGWLKSSDRLDASRVRQIREVFKETLTQQKSREEEAKAKAEAEQKAAEEQAKAARPPVTAADTLELKLEQSKADQERMDALRRDAKILQDTLKRERAQLDADKAAFLKEKAEFEQARKVVAQTEGNAQFKKALATLEGLKPDKIKATLQQLIDAKDVDQAVAYLNAMQERTRARVIDEFIKSDPKVATDLLERLRTRGMIASVPEAPPG